MQTQSEMDVRAVISHEIAICQLQGTVPFLLRFITERTFVRLKKRKTKTCFPPCLRCSILHVVYALSQRHQFMRNLRVRVLDL